MCAWRLFADSFPVQYPTAASDTGYSGYTLTVTSFQRRYARTQACMEMHAHTQTYTHTQTGIAKST